MAPRIRLWQRWMVAACGVMLVLEVAAIAFAVRLLPWAAYYSEASGPFVQRVLYVQPGAPPDRSGLREGDEMLLRALPAPDRFRMLLGGPPTYSHTLLPIRRAGRVVKIDLYLDRPAVGNAEYWKSNWWNFCLGWVGVPWMLAVVGVLAWRRPDRAAVRTLALLLFSVAAGQVCGWITPWAAVDLAGHIASPLFFAAGSALLVVYASSVGTPLTALRRLMSRVSCTAIAAAAAVGLAEPLGAWFGFLDPTYGLVATAPFLLIVSWVPALLPVACAALAIRDTRGDERARMAWATASLGSLLLGPAASATIVILTPGSSDALHLSQAIYNLSFFVAPVGITYALLGRRLLDVGFALNRTAVFVAVSLVVVGLFELGEWALSGWLLSASKSTNVAVSALLALVLGVAVYPIQIRTDKIIDHLFFRKRHEAERALRIFADEAAFMTDGELIVERAQALLERYTDCSFSAICRYDGVAKYGEVDENDAAFVTLRTTHRMLLLTSIDTALKGEIAFPISARGRLIGALVLGAKRLGGSYAPDECEAIGALAHGIGFALDALAPSHQSTALESAAIFESLQSIAATLERLSDRLDGRPESLASRRTQSE